MRKSHSGLRTFGFGARRSSKPRRGGWSITGSQSGAGGGAGGAGGGVEGHNKRPLGLALLLMLMVAAIVSVTLLYTSTHNILGWVSFRRVIWNTTTTALFMTVKCWFCVTRMDMPS